MEKLDYLTMIKQGQWHLNAVYENIPLVAEQGFTDMIVGPFQGLKEDYTFDDCPWWATYQPTNLEIGNLYGTEKMLERNSRRAEEYGIHQMADIVITHMAQRNDGTPYPHERVDPSLTDNPYFFRPPIGLSGPEYDDRSMVTHLCAGGLPGLNLYNWELQDKIFDLFGRYIDCGVTHFRIDSGKNIPLPSESYDESAIRKRILDKNPGIDQLYLNQAFCDGRPCDFLPRLEEYFAKRKVKAVLCFEVLNVWTGWLFNQYADYGYVLTDCRNHPDPRAIVSPETHDQYWNPDPHRQNIGAVSADSDWGLVRSYSSLVMQKDYVQWTCRPDNDTWKDPEIRQANQMLREKVYTKTRKVS